LPAFSEQHDLHPSPDMHRFYIWYFALGPKCQYNVIRGLGLVQPRIILDRWL
jgi:hypothetical protein